MKKLILSAIDEIKNNKSSCIVLNDGKVVKNILSRGIKPILEAFNENVLFGSEVIDKVVGRAAALVMVQGGVKYCYAINISEGAAQVFADYGIDFEYESISPYIVNRTGDGVCPMEQAVRGITNPEAAIEAINKKLAEFSDFV